MEIDRIKAVYAELDRYSVTLHSDPITLGPKYLQDTIAKIRNFLNAVSKLILDVGEQKHHLTREIRRREDALKILLDETMAHDERVKRQPNIRDREALANTIHAEECKAISAMKLDLDGLALVEKAIRHRHNELKDTMADVKTQKSLMQSEIDTGSMYGDERTPRTVLNMPDEMSEEEADRILSGTAPSLGRPAATTISFEPPEPTVEAAPITKEESKPAETIAEEPTPIVHVELSVAPDPISGKESIKEDPLPAIAAEDDMEAFLDSMSSTIGTDKTEQVLAVTSETRPAKASSLVVQVQDEAPAAKAQDTIAVSAKAPDSDHAIERFLNGGAKKAAASSVEDDFMALLDD